MDDVLIEDLRQAADGAAALVEGVGDRHWDAATPCPDWDVRALVGHLAGGNRHVAAALAAVPPPAAAPAGAAPADTAPADTAFRPGCEDLVRAAAAAAPDDVVEIPFGRVPTALAVQLRIAELLTHGWDLARATGQAPAFPEPVVERSLRFSLAALSALPPGRTPFAPSQPCPDGASTLDRLAATLGRNVGWAPPAGPT